ncbi:MAG: oligosaccharide flippase family protein [Halobacteriovoraceae bacterium]|nr:oligosaccharide flippase family protein [Halobacteriovoraceae bacterium]
MSSLKKEISINILGNLAFALSYWAFSVLISRELSAEGLGEFSLALSISAPFALLFGLQLRMRLNALSIHEVDWSLFVSTRILFSIFCFACISIISVFILGYGLWNAIVLLALLKTIEMNSDICFAIAQKHKKLHLVGVSQILKAITSVSVFWYFISYGLEAACLSLCVIYLGYFLFFDLPIAKRTQEFALKINISESLKLAKLALPLGISALLVSLNVNIPKYFLSYFKGNEDLGIFSAAYYFYIIGALVINSLGQSALVRLSESYLNNIKHYTRISIKVVGGSTLLALGIMVFVLNFGNDLLTFIYGPEFHLSHIALFHITLMTVFGFFATANTFVILGLQVFDLQFRVTVAMIAITSVTCLVTIPRWGIAGAAIPLTLSQGFQGLCYLTIAYFKIKRAKQVN